MTSHSLVVWSYKILVISHYLLFFLEDGDSNIFNPYAAYCVSTVLLKECNFKVQMCINYEGQVIMYVFK
jgi:hypothetical protein